MNNLFVCHTQYNLLLSSGLALSDFQNDQNDLILFEDFSITEDLKNKLKLLFNKTVFINHMPVILSSSKEKMKRISSDIEILKTWLNIYYDRLFIVEDMCIQEMFIMKRVSSMNRNIEMSWIEDGSNAYFDNGVVSGGMGSGALKRLLRKSVFTVRFGLYGYYELASCMGGHKKLTSAYLTFPQSVRKELEGKQVKSISQDSVEKGMQLLYPGESFAADENSVLIALDKLDRYGEDLGAVIGIVEKLVVLSEKKNRTVYYKLHPRENQMLEPLKRCIELEKGIAAESYLIHCPHRKMQVVGIMTTTLQTALKIGYKATSYVKLMKNVNPDIVKFYENIGIECPEAVE